MDKIYPCDELVVLGYEDDGREIVGYSCPYSSNGETDCQYYCGLGVSDADEFEPDWENDCDE